MRVGYEYMLPGETDTGVEIATRNLLDALIKANTEHDFKVYTRKQASKQIPKDSRITQNLSRIASTSRIGRIAWQQAILPLILRSKPVDIYHATGYVVSPFLPVPTILSIYDTIALENPELTRKINSLHYRLTLPASIRAAQRIIVPTNYVKSRIVELTNTPSNKVTVIPLGISECFKVMDKDKARTRLESLGRWSQQKYILAVGNVEPKKNLKMLIEAFATLPAQLNESLHLVIVGNPCAGKKELIQYASQLGVAQRIIFTGYVDDETLVALYNCAELFTYPTLDEGFGLPPIEAMACGTPVITSNAGALPETTGSMATLLSPYAPEAWATAIEKIATHSSLQQEHQERGVSYAKNFTWRNTANSVLEVYTNCSPNTR